MKNDILPTAGPSFYQLMIKVSGIKIGITGSIKKILLVICFLSVGKVVTAQLSVSFTNPMDLSHRVYFSSSVSDGASYYISTTCGAGHVTVCDEGYDDYGDWYTYYTGEYASCLDGVTYNWNFGDGTSSSLPNPDHLYSVSGTYHVSLTISDHCGSQVYNKDIVNSLISGPSGVCIGGSVTLTPTISGGTWSSRNTSVAIVDPYGVVTGIGAGIDTIIYTVGGTSNITTVVVNPYAGALSGLTNIYVGQTTLFSNTNPSGTWASSNLTVAIPDTLGNVTGVSVGSAVITYRFTNSCGTAYTTTTINVGTLGTTANYSYTGRYQTYLVPSGVNLISVDMAGGSGGRVSYGALAAGWYGWYCNGGGGGQVVCSLAVTPGELLYIYTGGKGTNGSYPGTYPGGDNSGGGANGGMGGGAAAGGGAATDIRLIPGNDFTSLNSRLIVAAGGGGASSFHWGAGGGGLTGINSESAHSFTAGVDGSGGTQTGPGFGYGGTAGFGYGADGASCCYTGGGGGGWYGGGSGYSDWQGSGAGGSSFYDNPNVSNASTTSNYWGCCGYPDNGYVNIGISINNPMAGITRSTIYNGCGAISPMLYLTGAAPITIPGITYHWQSSNDSLSWGLISGATNCYYNPTISSSIYYRCVVTNSSSGLSSNSVPVSIHINPAMTPITASTYMLCPGVGVNFYNSTPGGLWSSSNPAIATVGSTGIVTAITAGTVTISYSNSPCFAVQTVTISPSPYAGIISGSTGFNLGQFISLHSTVFGGIWTSSNISVANVASTSGIVTGVASGTAIISYTTTNYCGSNSSVYTITVAPAITSPCSSWEYTGGAGFSWGAYYPAMAVDPAGTPFMIYEDSLNGWKATVKKFNGSSWVTVGNPGFSSGYNNYNSIAFDAGGTPYVSYMDNSMANKACVMKFNGSNWVSVGSAGFSAGAANFISLAIDAGGTPYVVYQDAGNSSKATVMKFNGSAWVSVGGVGISYGPVTWTSIAINGSGTPYITYSDNYYSGATSIMKFNGSSWEYVGGSGSGGGYNNYYNKIAINSSGVPYIAYSDGNSSYVPRVGKFNGSYWEYVGPSTLYSNTAYYPSLVINALGTPCLAYYDYYNGGKASVGYFDGTNWNYVGNPDFSLGTVAYISLAIDANGKAYAAYGDGGYHNNATVKQLNTYSLPAITGGGIVCPGSTTSYSNTTSGGVWSSSNNSIATVGSSTGIVTGVAIGSALISYALTGSCIVTKIISVVNAPAITSVSPLYANPNSTITITGSNFNSTLLSNVVYLGATKATVTAATPSSLSVTVPYGATYMDVSTNNTTCGLIGYSGIPFLPSFDNSTYVSNGVNFDPKVDYSTPSHPHFAEIGDIDGDGKPDLITSSETSNTLSIYRNISTSGAINSGSFGPRVDFTTASGPGHIALADFNGDGKLDIAVLDYLGNSVSVFRNTSVSGVINSSSLAAKVDFATGTHPFGIAALDFDGDGKVDIVCGDQGDSKISVFRNTGNVGVINSSTFATKVDFVTGINPQGLSAGDIDGDGKPDIAIVNLGSVGDGTTVSVFRNTSSPGSFNTGSLSAKVDFTTGTGPYGVLVSDINGDNKPDLVVANTVANTVSILNNTSSVGSITSSSFAAKVDFTTGINPSMLAVGDINGDGKPDVVITNNGTNTVSVFRNTSSAGIVNSSTFAAKADFVVGGTGPDGVSVGDLDGDGKPDIVVANTGANSMSLLRNNLLRLITGPTNVCVGSTIILTDSTSGGTWTSSNISVAIVGTSSGIVTGVTAGTAIISYTVSAGVYSTSLVTVNPLPYISTISGPSSVCVGSSIGLINAAIGGSWSSSSAHVSVSGSTITGVSAGTAIISYQITNSCGTALATYSITVNPSPDAGSITGTTTLCVGGTTTLHDAASGGVWRSNDISVATIDSATGLVTGLRSGSTIIVYIVTNSCGSNYTSTIVTVNPSPDAGIITGPSSVCVGSSVGLINAAIGGSWSSSSAHVSVSGSTITGVSAGTAIISYQVVNSCGTALATYSVTVNPTPDAGTITGTTTLCVGGTTTLYDAVSGGVWRSNDISVATIDSATGLVTGVRSGSTIIVYIVTNSCGSNYTSTIVTVTPTPDAGIITGPSSVCVGSSVGLGNSAIGGSWSSSSAHVSVSGSTITGVSAGTAIISYQVTNSCGTALATYSITVNPSPDAGTITGTTTLCVGGTTTLHDAVSGGVWRSNDISVATIDSATGLVTGVRSGSTIIVYIVTNSCGSNYTSTIVTVTPAPDAGIITGPSSVCVGSSVGLGNSAIGGSWSSSSAHVSVSGSTITGVSAGTAIISYQVTNSCGTVLATYSITVNSSPDAGSITGTTTLCVGGTTTLHDAASGGVWRSNDISVATIDSATGLVTGLRSGSTIIIYIVTNSCGSNYTSTIVTVNDVPNVSPITGASIVCIGANTTLTSAPGSGIWSSANLAIATVGSISGIVHGISTGSVNISYVVTNSCGTSTVGTTMNVNPTASAGIITGGSIVCTGNTLALNDSVSGGVWSSSVISRATVGSTGIVSGITAGTTVISYTVNNGCGMATTTKIVTINNSPAAGTITGLGTVATFASIPLTDAISGGVWSSGTPSVATVGSTGIVTGVTPGSVIISYSVTNSCGTATAIKTINVTSSLAPIVGAGNVCPGGSTPYTDATHGGTWSSSNRLVATVGSLTGLVYGISTGTATISYTILGNTVTAVITVSSSTPPITGVTTMCAGTSSLLTNISGGGTWISSNPAKATVNILSGYITGVSAGTTTISYNTSCGLVTTIVTVNTAPLAITGPTAICQGSSVLLADATAGGVWSSSNAAIASVGTTGRVSGISGGTAIISYTIGTGCSATALVTVNALFSNTGITTVCLGQTTVINNPAPGGLWNSSNTAVATVNCNLGIAKGVSLGTSVISYTLGTGCTSTIPITVISLLPISGASGVCVGTTTTLYNTSRGGAWSSSDTTIAKVDSASGLVSGITIGNAIITYSFGTGCRVNQDITVLNLPANSGANNVCLGGTTTITNTVAGGTWVSSNPSVASVVGASGLITGLSTGTSIITYYFGSSCTSSTTFVVNPLPAAVSVTGGGTYCNSTTITASGGGGDIIYFQGTTMNGTSTAAPSSSQVVTTSGTYYFRAQSAAGCWGPQGSVTVLIPVITGPTTVCTGTTTTLGNTGGAVGRWSSSNPAIGSVNPATGVVSGRTIGTITIYDTLPSGCIVSTPVTVGTAPSISGPGVVCNGQSISLTNLALGGTWSSSSLTIATVGSTGIVTGVGPGLSATITYSLGATCRSTTSISVAASSPISVNGNGIVCVGQTITMSNPVAGGSWSSSSGSIATAGTGGIITGVTAGMAIISYTLPSGCITTTSVSTKVLSAITGPASVCVGQTITLTDTTLGGIWGSATPTIATIGSLSGKVTGVAGNLNALLTYTLGTGCKTTISVSVNPLTAIGSPGSVCQGQSINLTELTPGGTWSSANSSLADFASAGVLSGLSAGIVAVSYILPTGCTATTDVYVNPVAPIVGPATVCLGQTIQLTESAGAGTWSSGAVTIATVGTTGVVKGMAANNSATITYTFCTGCKTTMVVSVNPLSVIAGATSVCQGLITTMTDATVGGIWSSSATGVLDFASTNGNVTGISAGTATISYILPTGCTSVMTMTVNPLSPILGPNGVCYQKTISLTNLVPGGAWSSAAPAIASVVSSTGIVTGATGANNSTTITYTTSASCKATKVVSVYALPAAPPAILGPATVSLSGPNITLTNTTTGGTWSSSNTGRATVMPTTGVVSGVGLGSVIITYTVANAAGCTNQVTKIITVGPVPPPHSVTDKSVSINIGASITLNETAKGRTWFCNDCDGIVSLNPEKGTITGIAQGRATITYTVDDEIGSSITITKVIVNPLPESVITFNKEDNVYLIPNPNKGTFTIKGNLATATDEEITIEVVDVIGQTIYKGYAKAIEGRINEQVVLSNTLANGIYLLNLYSNAEHYVFHFVVER